MPGFWFGTICRCSHSRVDSSLIVLNQKKSPVLLQTSMLGAQNYTLGIFLGRICLPEYSCVPCSALALGALSLQGPGNVLVGAVPQPGWGGPLTWWQWPSPGGPLVSSFWVGLALFAVCAFTYAAIAPERIHVRNPHLWLKLNKAVNVLWLSQKNNILFSLRCSI